MRVKFFAQGNIGWEVLMGFKLMTDPYETGALHTAPGTREKYS